MNKALRKTVTRPSEDPHCATIRGRLVPWTRSRAGTVPPTHPPLGPGRVRLDAVGGSDLLLASVRRLHLLETRREAGQYDLGVELGVNLRSALEEE